LKSTIAPPDQPPADNKTDELRQLIERIRSVQVEPQQPVRHPTDAAPTASPELNTITPQANPAAQPASESIPAEPLPAATSSSEQTFQTVKNLLKDSNQIAAPLELAEALYRSGKPALAGLCYKKALTLTDANDPNKASERAWILFQTGNCLKYDDPNTAKESYAQLLRTYPNSPWVEVAKTRHDLIDLFQQDETSKLIHPPKP
jgi:tetratricopeptide (TPR) repeat protein